VYNIYNVSWRHYSLPTIIVLRSHLRHSVKKIYIFWSRLISLAALFRGRYVRNWPVPLIFHVRVFNPTATSTCFTFKDFACYRGDVSLLRRTTDGFLWRDTYALVCGALPYCLSSSTPPRKATVLLQIRRESARPSGLECYWTDSEWHILRCNLHQQLTACHVW